MRTIYIYGGYFDPQLWTNVGIVSFRPSLFDSSTEYVPKLIILWISDFKGLHRAMITTMQSSMSVCKPWHSGHSLLVHIQVRLYCPRLKHFAHHGKIDTCKNPVESNRFNFLSKGLVSRWASILPIVLPTAVHRLNSSVTLNIAVRYFKGNAYRDFVRCGLLIYASTP